MTTPEMDDIIDLFQGADREMRLELLLDYAEKLPPVPERYRDAVQAGAGRVPECVTPVFLFSEPTEDGGLRLFVDVAEEAPTVKGLMSIIVAGCDGQSPAVIADLPNDLLARLGLDKAIGAQRTMGFAGILTRVKREAAMQGQQEQIG